MKHCSYAAALSAAGLLALVAGAASAQTVTVSGGTMTINTSAYSEDQEMEIRVGPTAGQVRLFGVIGAPSTTFTGITVIHLTTGPRNDYVEFRIFSAVAPRITARTGAGNSDVKVLYQLGSGVGNATSTVTVIGGTGNDKVLFDVYSFAQSFVANWSTQQGAGDNETVGVTDSPNASNRMSVSLSSVGTTGKDKYDLNVKSRAANIVVNASPTTGGSDDSAIIKIDTTGSGTTTAALAVLLGDGGDVFELTNVSRGGPANFSGTVNGGAGDDELKFSSEANGNVNMTFNGAAGKDKVDFFAKGNVRGRPRLLGGTGDDSLKLVIDGPELANPYFDGGPGYDIAQGFGTFVNCEEIN